MTRRRNTRSRRKRGPKRPVPAPGQAPTRPVAAPVPLDAPPAAEQPETGRSPTRYTMRDYHYVQRDLRRILVLATAVVVAIVVLSFFLP